VEFTDDAVELLAREGFDPEFGARPLRRTIQRPVENELSRILLSDEIVARDRITIDAVEGELRFDVERDGVREEATDLSKEVEATTSTAR
jgi:ATP-dependent Clp protease ATP-binding subunit ClpC